MRQIKVELQDWMGDDRAVSEAAWTSSLDYQKKENRSEQDVERVVKLLADSKHSVPFESIVLRFWIKMPIAIDRQYMTHRLQSASGMSGRYRTMPDEWLEFSSDVYEIYSKVHQNEAEIVQDKYNEICELANKFYQNESKTMKSAEKDGLITNKEYKRIREFLRGVLPQHNMTERVSIINLRSFANFYRLRFKPDAQPEIQQIAKLMLEQIKTNNVAPLAIQWLEENNWNI